MDDSAVILLEYIQVDDRLNYIERPMVILDRKTKTLRNKVVELVKFIGSIGRIHNRLESRKMR